MEHKENTTNCLFSDPSNAAFLDEQIAFVRSGGELVEVELKELRNELKNDSKFTNNDRFNLFT